MDRHVTEFYPGLCRAEAYGRTGRERLQPGGRSAGDKTFAKMAAIACGEQPLDEKVFQHAPGEHEQLVMILECLAGKGRGVFSVNLPNGGRVPGVPADAILEGMALIDEGGVRTLDVGRVPPALAVQMAHRAVVTELTAEAALTGDVETMARAMHVEGGVTRPAEALALAKEMVEAQIEHLPQFRR